MLFAIVSVRKFVKCTLKSLHVRIISKRRTSTIPTVTETAIDGTISPAKAFEADYVSFKKHGSNPTGLVQFEAGPVNYLVPSTADTMKELFKLDAKGSVDTIYPPTFRKLVTGKAMSMMPGGSARHKQLRKLLAPFMLMDEGLRDRVDVVKDYAQKWVSSIKTDEYTQILPVSKKYAFDVVFGVTFGNKIFTEELSDKIRADFEVYSLGFSDLNMENLEKEDTWLGQGMLMREVIANDIEVLIKQCTDLYHENKLDPKSIIYKMIDGKVFEDMDEFKYNIENLVWAGHDTTAATICNVLYFLDQYPSHPFIGKLKERVKANNASDFDFILNDDLMDAFVKEVVRMLPAVGRSYKYLTKDEEIGGCPMKQGTLIFPTASWIGKSEGVFGENADEFDPQRFIDNPPSKMTWYPFGLGNKICIGWKLAYLEMKMVTGLVLSDKEYVIELDQNRLEKHASSPFLLYDVYGKRVKM